MCGCIGAGAVACCFESAGERANHIRTFESAVPGHPGAACGFQQRIAIRHAGAVGRYRIRHQHLRAAAVLQSEPRQRALRARRAVLPPRLLRNGAQLFRFGAEDEGHDAGVAAKDRRPHHGHRQEAAARPIQRLCPIGLPLPDQRRLGPGGGDGAGLGPGVQQHLCGAARLELVRRVRPELRPRFRSNRTAIRSKPRRSATTRSNSSCINSISA